MPVESLGEALSYGWRVTAKRHPECRRREELDMSTLVWTRGRSFPLSRLESRLRCPRCGSRDVVLLITIPSETQAIRARSR